MPSLSTMPSISALTASHRHGYCLEGGFYLREDVFEKDLELLLGRWICAGHVSNVAHPGDWLTVELGAESAIVVRGDDGVLRALANVCRHRGSRICEGERGSAAILTCPYHAWTYHLDGRLRRAREMPEGFDPDQHGLQPLRLEEIGGLIFISFGTEPPRLEEARRADDRALWLANRQGGAAAFVWRSGELEAGDGELSRVLPLRSSASRILRASRLGPARRPPDPARSRSGVGPGGLRSLERFTG